MQKAVINLETLTCPSCIQKIKKAVKNINGIDKDSVEVLFNSSKVKTNFDADAVSIEEIEKAIETMGYPVIRSRVRAA